MSEGQTTRSNERQSELQPPVNFGQFQLTLPNFEGPLDLLLHLIREHKLDIFDIPIALVTEKYLEYLARIKEINLDIAGEFLVMASTLAHIKSRLLLPRPQIQGEAEAEEEVDPRAELVRRLLEYQKYRDVAETLVKRSLLGRDVFCRTAVEVVAPADGDLGLVEISVYQLIETLDRVLKNATPQVQHEVIRDRLSVSDAIHDVAERLRAKGKVSFFSLFAGQRQHQKIIVTFLAALEMCRLKLIHIFLDESGEIVLAPRGEALTNAIGAEVDENEYR